MITVLQPEFVEFIPEKLEDGKIYVSEAYATASHNCCCGCGNRVVTPLSPTGWKLIVDRGAVTLHPSIGNWSFPCQSHYWIRRNRVVNSYQMTDSEIAAVRRQDAKVKSRYFDSFETSTHINDAEPTEETQSESVWRKLVNWLLG